VLSSWKTTAPEVPLTRNRGKWRPLEQTPEGQNKKTVLVVNDEPTILESVSRLLEEQYDVLAAPTAKKTFSNRKISNPKFFFFRQTSKCRG
jgi:PleD family two-component response regulator